MRLELSTVHILIIATVLTPPNPQPNEQISLKFSPVAHKVYHLLYASIPNRDFGEERGVIGTSHFQYLHNHCYTKYNFIFSGKKT